jgi:hypothetical protein
VAHQGAGHIWLPAALATSGGVSPSSLPLGEVPGTATRTLTLVNRGTVDASYQVGHAPAVAVTGNYVPTRVVSDALVVATPETVLVPAGGSATVVVAITPDAGLAEPGLFSGFLTFTSASETLRVPYLGLKGDQQGISVLGPLPPVLARPTSATTFVVLPTGGSFTLAGLDQPSLRVHFDHFAERVKIEVLRLDGTHLGFAYDAKKMGRSDRATTTSDLRWDGTLTQGGRSEPIGDGTYLLRLTVLRAGGDQANPAHLETWTSPPVTIQRAL